MPEYAPDISEVDAAYAALIALGVSETLALSIRSDWAVMRGTTVYSSAQKNRINAAIQSVTTELYPE